MTENQKLREALQEALSALETCTYDDVGDGSGELFHDEDKVDAAIKLAHQAIALPITPETGKPADSLNAAITSGAAPVGELPELPAASFTYERRPAGCEPERVPAYTADQMHNQYLKGFIDGQIGDADGRRLDWVRDNLFVNRWNGVVGPGCSLQWQVVPDYRFKARNLTESSGIAAGDFRRAIDAAMARGGE